MIKAAISIVLAHGKKDLKTLVVRKFPCTHDRSSVSSAFTVLAQERICLSNSAAKILSSCIFRSSMVLFLQARAATYVHIPWLLKANSGQSIVFTLSDVVSGLNKCLLLEGMQNYCSHHGYIFILQ